MPIFTALATALLAGTALSGTFAVGALAFGLQAATAIGLNYAAKALAGHQDTPTAAAVDHFSAQGTLQTGGDVPRSFNVGYSVTAGSLAYANTWGADGGTPNAYFTQVIPLSDLPGGILVETWVNGELCALDTGAATDMGAPVLQYRKDGRDHVWIKYYDGTQTQADAFLVSRVASADRPYPSTRVGHGVAYAICTALVEDTLFTGFPTYKFAVSGIPLYDPSKDTTVGGSGAHRWSDRSTWGGDGDSLPAVQIYNILRGLTFNGAWVYGLQSMTAARLPTVNWIAQINKCRDVIIGADGAQATYRAGGQINVDTQPANSIEALLTACQGRLSEIGGFYKVHLGAPESPTFQFTDDDILSTEAQNFAPFFPLSDSINGITATYPNPGEGWASKAAPPIYRTDYEVRDGNRRLLANPSFDFVPYAEQVQRLMKSALEEAQRARRHTMVMPPAFWLVEPGDVGEWTSARNGYISKMFRADGVVDEPNLDVSWNLTEVDPSDYSWSAAEFQPVFSGPTSFPRPEAQGIVDWFAEPAEIKDADGFSRRPAIRLAWDGDMPGVIGVQYEVRLASDHSDVARGRSDQLAASALLISQSLLPDTNYETRGQYIPSAPRDMLWSDWIAVKTPNVLLTFRDLDAAVVSAVTEAATYNDVPIKQLVDTVAAYVANQDARNWTDQARIRTQIAARSDAAHAEIVEVQTVAADMASAFADYQVAVSATFGSINSTITTQSTAIAQLNGYAAAQYSVTLDVNGYAVGFNLLNGGGGVSSATFTVDKFQIAYPGVTGGAAVPIFTVANVNGAPKVAIRGDMIVDGSVTTQKMMVGTLTSITNHFGTATVDGNIQGSSGRMVLDFTNNRELFGD